MTRSEIQTNAANMGLIYPNILLSWCTGLGKTKAALDIVSKLPGRGYIILSELSHRLNWHDEIVKHGHEDIFVRSETFLYASLHKFKDTEVDWIIFDEVHRGLSGLRQNLISSIKSKNNIFLTATLDRDQRSMLRTLYPNLYINHISLEAAIEYGILPKPEINLYPIELGRDGKTQTIDITRDKKRNDYIECSYLERFSYSKQYPDDNIKIRCTEAQKYEYLTEQMDYWRDRYFSERMDWQKFKWLNLGSQRKRFLAEIKTPLANRIILDMNRRGIRYICFTGSIAQANILGWVVEGEKNVVHSKNKNNQDIINKFNAKDIHSLFAVNMLQEGANLRGIHEGLIVQLDSKIRSYTQRAGRLFRANKPVQHIIYVKGTRDEEFLNKALEGLEKYIQK